MLCLHRLRLLLLSLSVVLQHVELASCQGGIDEGVSHDPSSFQSSRPPFVEHDNVEPNFGLVHYCAIHDLTEKECLELEAQTNEKNNNKVQEKIKLAVPPPQPLPWSAAAIEITSPKNNSKYEPNTSIPLILTAGHAIPESSIVYKLDSNKAQSFSSGFSLQMDSLLVGSHTLTVQVLSDEKNNAGAPITSRMSVSFTIGELLTLLPSTPASTNSWYSVYPWHLYVRSFVFTTINPIPIQAVASNADAASLRFTPPSEPLQTTLRPLLSSSSCPSTYLLYRSPIHGLNNQKIDIMSAVAIANTVNRTLVLPYLFADLLQTKNEVLDFGEVFDSKYLKDALSEFVCLATFEELGSDFTDDAVVVLRHGSLQSLSYYDGLFGPHVHEKYVLLDRPVAELAQFPVNMMYLPALATQVRSALRPSPQLRHAASEIIRQFSPAYLAIHLRVEDDWKVHCASRERAHFNSLKMCYRPEDVAPQLSNFLEANNDVKDVYLAVGNDVSDAELAPIYALQATHGVKFWRKNGLLLRSLGTSISSFPHIKLAALDFEICSRATAFVGNSYSSFAQEIAKTFQGDSYIYNIDSTDFALRTDKGHLIEPLDATLTLNATETITADVVYDFLYLQSLKQKTQKVTSFDYTQLDNPYPIIRTDVSNNVRRTQATFTLFEHEEERQVVTQFCDQTFDVSEREECERGMCARTYIHGAFLFLVLAFVPPLLLIFSTPQSRPPYARTQPSCKS